MLARNYVWSWILTMPFQSWITYWHVRRIEKLGYKDTRIVDEIYILKSKKEREFIFFKINRFSLNIYNNMCINSILGYSTFFCLITLCFALGIFYMHVCSVSFKIHIWYAAWYTISLVFLLYFKRNYLKTLHGDA